MNHKAEILKTRFTKSIINSKVSNVNITIILEKKSCKLYYKSNDQQTWYKVFFLINIYILLELENGAEILKITKMFDSSVFFSTSKAAVFMCAVTVCMMHIRHGWYIPAS